MTKKNNYTKKDFLKFWGDNGYIETWDGHGYNWSKEIQDLVLNQIGQDKDKIVLEIGCGGGYWTKFLSENSLKVLAIDLIPKPLFEAENMVYFENKNNQFDCKSIEDESVDFVFSFGVFCHLSKNACENYLIDILRVLKKGGKAILMYADEKGLQKFYKNKTIKTSDNYGKYVDYDDFLPTVKKYDKTAKKILNFRDNLVLITKK
jgi:cyclopropane fatty-acyl-phospholipid synthase-like methyltransferase